ncbi:MAG: hypothetical protein R8K47_01195 [Mariprofundaceae bacterium]
MPQFDPAHFPAEIFWTLVSFLLLLVLLRRFVLPRIDAILHERAERIREEIETAQAERRAAEALRRDCEARLARADEEIRRRSDEADRRLRAMHERRMREWERRMRRRETAFIEDMRIAQNRAARELRRMTADHVVAGIERLLRESLTEDDHRRLIERALQRLERDG